MSRQLLDCQRQSCPRLRGYGGREHCTKNADIPQYPFNVDFRQPADGAFIGWLELCRQRNRESDRTSFWRNWKAGGGKQLKGLRGRKFFERMCPGEATQMVQEFLRCGHE